ncbi:hypothetical protein AVEN_91508-1 [Araneus ventricosus]|uniref:Uncharacterized protein n=1 Tax=Araneus ventricosus TaxID=182803 RepID=A0A4Y2BIR7_ARAVE|nr:hypothetical protein AVEN_91508-1 [Araneus ventricosus]
MTRTTIGLTPPRQTCAPHQWEDVCPPTYDLACNRYTYTADLQWNRVSNLEPLGTEAETLPLGHCSSVGFKIACLSGTDIKLI